MRIAAQILQICKSAIRNVCVGIAVVLGEVFQKYTIVEVSQTNVTDVLERQLRHLRDCDVQVSREICHNRLKVHF